MPVARTWPRLTHYELERLSYQELIHHLKEEDLCGPAFNNATEADLRSFLKRRYFPPEDEMEEEERAELLVRHQDCLAQLFKRAHRLREACDLILQSNKGLAASIDDESGTVVELKQRLSRSEASVVVAGPPRSGKSSVTNSLLGSQIAPEGEHEELGRAMKISNDSHSLSFSSRSSDQALGPARLCAPLRILGELISLIDQSDLTPEALTTATAAIIVLRADQPVQAVFSPTICQQLADARAIFERFAGPKHSLSVFEDSLLFVFTHWDLIKSTNEPEPRRDNLLTKLRTIWPVATPDRNVFFVASTQGSLEPPPEEIQGLRNAFLSLVPRALKAHIDAAYFWLQERLDPVEVALERTVMNIREKLDEEDSQLKLLYELVTKLPEEAPNETQDATPSSDVVLPLEKARQHLKDCIAEAVKQLQEEALEYLRSPEVRTQLCDFAEDQLPNSDDRDALQKEIDGLCSERLRAEFQKWNENKKPMKATEGFLKTMLEVCKACFEVIEELFPLFMEKKYKPEKKEEEEVSQVSDVGIANVELVILGVAMLPYFPLAFLATILATPVLGTRYLYRAWIRRDSLKKYKQNKRNFVRKHMERYITEITGMDLIKQVVREHVNVEKLQEQVESCLDKYKERIEASINEHCKNVGKLKPEKNHYESKLKETHVIQNHLMTYFYQSDMKIYELHFKNFDFDSHSDSDSFPSIVRNRLVDETQAIWPTIGLKVADGARLTYMREQAWQKLSMPCRRNVLKFYGILKFDRELYFVSEAYDGDLRKLLRSVVDRNVAGQETRVQRIGNQILNGIEQVHRCGFVIHELCPENVKYKGHGDAIDIRLFSFGRETDVTKESFWRINEGRLSPDFHNYASPETRIEDETRIEEERWKICTKASNIYTFGLILYELFYARPWPDISGRRTHIKATELFESLTEKAKGTRGVEMPVYLKIVIRQCIERDPKRRASIEEIKSALSQKKVLKAKKIRANATETLENM